MGNSPTDTPNNCPTLNHYLAFPYIGTPSIEFGKCIAASFHDRLDTDIKIAYETLKIISYFNLVFPLITLFCSKVVYKYICSFDKNMSYIDITTRQLLVRTENTKTKLIERLLIKHLTSSLNIKLSHSRKTKWTMHNFIERCSVKTLLFFVNSAQ